jgi:hypothetical protein
MAVIDVAGFIADVKSQAIDHGFHVHDERHFVETYSLRQLWEIDLHPEEACSGPIDLHLSLDVDPRAMLGFEDEVMKLDEIEDPPPHGFTFPLLFTWSIVAKMTIDLADVYMNQDDAVTTALDRCKHVSLYLLEHAPVWLGDYLN